MPAPAGATARTPTAPPTEQGPQSPANAAPLADRADIRPLDVSAALQILLAEVRSAFELLAIAMGDEANEVVNSPPQAARALLQMVLRALPQETGSTLEETADTPAWNMSRQRRVLIPFCEWVPVRKAHVR